MDYLGLLGLRTKAYKPPQISISVVLLNWKRVENVRHLLAHYSAMDIIGQIIIVNNGVDVIEYDHDKVIIIKSSKELGLFSRFAAAGLVKTEAVLIVDDDLEVPQKTIDVLYKYWALERNIVHGLEGRNTLQGEYILKNICGECEIVLTRCLITTPKLCSIALSYAYDFYCAFPSNQPTGNGEDIVLSYVARALSGQLNKTYKLRYAELSDQHAISKTNPNHLSHRSKAVQWCQKNILSFWSLAFTRWINKKRFFENFARHLRR